MGLRAQILTSPETVSDLALAAEARFRDSESLLTQGRQQGCVYLLGLSAEMWLKYACFRVAGARLSQPVTSLLGPARALMRAHVPNVAPEGYHNLCFWYEYLLMLRQARRDALPAELAGRLRHHVVNRLFDAWRVDLRYSTIPVSERDSWRSYCDVVWLRAHVSMLWR